MHATHQTRIRRTAFSPKKGDHEKEGAGGGLLGAARTGPVALKSSLSMQKHLFGEKTNVREQALVRRLIKAAQSAAKTAVRTDEHGHYLEAISYYETAAKAISTLPDKFLPAHVHTKLIQRQITYLQRAEVLKVVVSGRGTRFQLKRRLSLSALPFVELRLFAPAMALGEAETNEALRLRLKAFSSMRLLRNAVTDGGFLTRAMYFPQVIWEQNGAKLAGVKIKRWAIEVLVSKLLPLMRFCFQNHPKSPKPTLKNKERPRGFTSILEAANEALELSTSERLALGAQLKDLHNSCDSVQKRLHRYFHGVNDVSGGLDKSDEEMNSVGSVGERHEKQSKSKATRWERFTNTLSSAADAVANQAGVAAARLNTAATATQRTTSTELVNYGKDVCRFCDSSQVLVPLLKHYDRERQRILNARNMKLQGTDDKVKRSIRRKTGWAQRLGFRGSTTKSPTALLDTIEMQANELNDICDCICDVVLRLLRKDALVLMERFLRKTCKSFTGK